MEAGASVGATSTEVVDVPAVPVTGGAGDVGAVPAGEGGFAGVATFGGTAGFGGAGFSGLMPPSQDGPEYISAVKPLVFHLSSKSAAALLGVSPTPRTSFHG